VPGHLEEARVKENRDRGASERIRVLAVEPLTSVAFQAFGEVIEAPRDGGRPANDGTAQRYDDVAALVLTAGGGQPQLSLFRVCPGNLPLECRNLERHPLSSQAFVPVGAARFLVVVAPAGGPAPDAAGTRAFLARGGQGVNYRPGVWHHPVLALDAETDFVMVGRADDGHDCDLAPFAAAAVLRIDGLPE
jgi:ureidoglycolate lyase